MATYYNMAHRVIRRGDCNWPYDIDISFDEVACPVGFAEGIGQGVGAITVTAAEALSETWKQHFQITHSQWLIPYLQNLARGIPLPREEMFSRFYKLHDRMPKRSEFWP
jgi:hypothetical protein